MRAQLGLLSPNFRLGVLRLERPCGGPSRRDADSTSPGSRVACWTRRSRNSERASWVRVARPKPRPTAASRPPCARPRATRYRLTGSGLRGPRGRGAGRRRWRLRRVLLAVCALTLLALGVHGPRGRPRALRWGARRAPTLPALTGRARAADGPSRSRASRPFPRSSSSRRPRRASHGLDGVRYVERVPVRRVAFVPNDPLVAKQWYLAQNRAYDAWTELPPLAGVRVAVIDSGVDAGHPELARADRRRAQLRRRQRPRSTSQGHGTFVAGLIAAEIEQPDGDRGSFAGRRAAGREGGHRRADDPGGRRGAGDPLGRPVGRSRDQHVARRAARSARAVAGHVLAARSRRDRLRRVAERRRRRGGRQRRPGSAAAVALRELARGAAARAGRQRARAATGSSPAFSNRDAVYNDIAAPGQEIVSTFPRGLTAKRHACEEQGYSLVRAGRVPVRGGDVVRGAAGERRRGDVARHRSDAARRAGRRRCSSGRRSTRTPRTAAGRARSGATRTRAGGGWTSPRRWPRSRARSLRATASSRTTTRGAAAYTLWGPKRQVEASLDFWDDQNDVYRIRLRSGQRVYASLVGPRGHRSRARGLAPGHDERRRPEQAGSPRERVSVAPGRTTSSATAPGARAGTTSR